MSQTITIQRQPEQLQPTHSDGLFYTVSSTQTSNFKYRYIYKVYVNNVLIFTGKSTPNPQGLGVIDVQEILKSYANSTVNVTPDTYIHKTEKLSLFDEREVLDYYVVFGEEYATSLTSSVQTYTGLGGTGQPSVFSQVRKVYNGTYPTNQYANRQDFDYGPYIFSGTPAQYQQGLFLTNSPRIVDIGVDDYHTLSCFNYYLGGDLYSYAYQVEYDFYDSDGVSISSTTVDNFVSNGGGPLTGLTAEMYDTGSVVSSAYTFNVLNIAAGPKNLQQQIGFPSNTGYYTVTVNGVNQSSAAVCGSGYTPGYIESCYWGYQIPVCIPTGITTTDQRYWPSGISQWTPDCFFIASYGGPGGEYYTGGTSYEVGGCGLCLDIQFGGIPESPPNIIGPGTTGTPATFSAISETFQFNIEDDCDVWNNKQIIWKNRYGTYDYYKFQKRKSEGLNIERQTYQQIPVSWGSSNPQKTQISRGVTDFNVSINESHVVNTGFVNQATMVWLEEVYTSPDVYLIETDGTLFPINITSTEYIRKNRGNRELINLELTYTYSNNIEMI